MRVIIGDNKFSNYVLESVSKNKYNLIIENYFYSGVVQIKVKANSVLDKAGNGNVDTTLDTSVEFASTYRISYDLNQLFIKANTIMNQYKDEYLSVEHIIMALFDSSHQGVKDIIK